MDLTSQSSIKITHDVDPDTNVVTITLLDSLDGELGTIEIENIKYRAFMRALETFATERVTPLMPQVSFRSNYEVNTGEGEIFFG